MSAVTLRNLSPEVVRIIRKRATERKTSINKVVAGILEEGLGLAGSGDRPAVHHDLDHFAGRWTKKEADAINRDLAGQRHIDPELWR